MLVFSNLFTNKLAQRVLQFLCNHHGKRRGNSDQPAFPVGFPSFQQFWISLFSAVLDFLIFSIGLHYFQHFHFMKSLQLGIKVISEEVAIQAKVIYASFFKLPPFGTFSKVDISPNLSSQSSQNLNNLHLSHQLLIYKIG